MQMTPIYVTLSEAEMLNAAIAGCQRQVISLRKGRVEAYGASDRGNPWQINVQGAIAEMAFARMTRKNWVPAIDGHLTELEGDVGWYQIRSTYRTDGHLIVHPNDVDVAPYVFAVVKEPRVKFVGWLLGSEAKVVGEWRKKDECWVRQDQLKDMADLPR